MFKNKSIQSGYIEFHVALDNPALDGLCDGDFIHLDTPTIAGMFQIDYIDKEPQSVKGVKCAKIRLKEYTIYQPYHLKRPTSEQCSDIV